MPRGVSSHTSQAVHAASRRGGRATRRWERRALLVAAEAAGKAAARDDGRAQNRVLRTALTSAAFDQVRMLADPGRGRLLEELRSFCAAADRADVLLLALSGRIVRDGEGVLYFPAAPSGRRLEHSAVELDDVGEAIRGSRARATVVLLDCHYSGWYDDGPEGRTATVPQFDIRRVFPVEKCVVIAAPREERRSGTPGTAPSCALSTAEALTGAAKDRDGDGWIDTADLEEYLRSAWAGSGPAPVLITDAPPAPLARSRRSPAPQLSDPAEADGDLAAEVALRAAGLFGECRTGQELRDRLRAELRAVGFDSAPAAEAAAGAELLLSGGAAPASARPRDPSGQDPETEAVMFGLQIAALALRLRRGRETGADHEMVRASVPSEWTSPLGDARWRTLLAHHRDALSRAAVRTQLVDLRRTDHWTLLRGGRESLVSGGVNAVAAGPGERRLASGAARRGLALRYGYPLVVVRSGSDGSGPVRGAAPLFVMDVRVCVRDSGPVLAALGPGELNPALLRTGVAGLTADAEYEALRGWWHAQQEAGGVRDFVAKTRLLLAYLGVNSVDDIAPGALRGEIDPDRARPGAHNLAVLFHAGTERFGPLLADLDDTSGDGMDVTDIGATALAALTGGADPEPRNAEPVLPVTAVPLSESHYRAVESALTRRLTVVAAPPGTGSNALVTAAAHTAIAAGQSVLFAGPDADSADAFVRRAGAETGIEHLVVRTGGPEHLAAEAAALDAVARTRAEGADPEQRRVGPERDWAASRVARLAIDAISRTERELALLADARGRIIGGGWDPGALFRARRPQEWLRLSEQAKRRFLTGSLRRLWRRFAEHGLGAPIGADGLSRVGQIARVELAWSAAVDVWRRTTSLEELHDDLVAVTAKHRSTGVSYLAAVVGHRRAKGRPAVARRREALEQSAAPPVWSGFAPSLEAFPAWAVAAEQARALPPRAGLFDLVIVDAADRCGVAAVLPLLYRAKRALIVGDPARPAPAQLPEESGGARGGPVPRWIAERGLGGPGASAYRALARAATESGGRVLWLDEHDRSHPLIAEAADRCCYGGKLSVLTDPGPLPGADRPVRWHDAGGQCEQVSMGSYVNREEARRAAALLMELDARLPDTATIGVASPFRHQRALVRRLVERDLSREVRIEALSSFGPNPCDAVVVSPVLNGTAPVAPARELSTPEAWSPVLTTAVARLLVVGDRRFWCSVGGVPAVLAGLDATRAGPEADPAVDALVCALRGRADEVTPGPVVQGHAVDLRVATPHGPVLVVVDRTRDGRGLRRLLRRLSRLRAVTGLPVLRAPAWRCLHTPEELAREILLAGPGWLPD